MKEQRRDFTSVVPRSKSEVRRRIEGLVAQERKDVIARLSPYTEHRERCILAQFEAGRPTKSGGYKQKYDGHWYQTSPVDETPKCDCGLDEILKNKNTKPSETLSM